MDSPIDNVIYEESGDYRNQWLTDRIPSHLGSDVVQERIMYQAVVGSQIPPFEMSAEIRDNGRQDATDPPSFSPSELPGDVGDVKLKDKNILDLEPIGTTSPDEQS
ncbi:MAG: hypothetical protein GY696_23600, partial [Gammaproteobacteria bacterium]|nr:hypothetical protein [Gammaproteobacteria bacterium]